MPGLTIHYIIALKSIERNNIKNVKEYIDGSFYPDFHQKQESHYTDKIKIITGYDDLIYKVNLLPYPKEHNIDTDHAKGYFLHLLTDYLFYHELCIKKYHKEPNFVNCLGTLGKEYTKINKALFELYSFGHEYIDDKYLQYFEVKDQDPEYFTKDELKKFIEHCAALDLEQEYKNIQNGILPTYDV